MVPHFTFSVLLRSIRRLFAVVLLALVVLAAIGAIVVVQASRDEATRTNTAILMLDGPGDGQAARLDRVVRMYLAGQISRIVLTGSDTTQARGMLVRRGVVQDKIAEVREPTEQGQLQAAQKLLQDAHENDALLIGEPVEALRLLKMAGDMALPLHSAPTGADNTIDLRSVADEVVRYLVYCFTGR
jgi:hypothetical protein